MGLWDGLESAEIFDSGQYFEPGQWIVEIVRCLPKRSKKTGQDLFIVECNVITSNRPDVPRGSRRSWCQGMKNRNVAMNAIKDFVVSVFDLPREDKAFLAREFDPYIVRTMDRITGAENPLKDRMCNLTTWHKSKQDKPQEVYTVHEWELYDYAAMGLPPPPAWTDVRVMHAPGYGAPAYGSPPPPPPYGAPAYGPLPGVQRTADGRFYLDPMSNTWQPVPVAAAPPPPPGPPPGVQRTADGRYWLDTRTNAWVAV